VSDGAGTGTYTYDANGNMTSDPYKAMTLRYNHLNLPTLFDFGAGKTIEVYYDRAGAKLRKTVKTNATTTQYIQDYVGGLEYRTTGTGALTLEAIYHTEGRITPVGANWQYEYSIRDHLGNTRLTFADLNNNGVVDVTGNNTTTEILNEYHYYPFGMNMAYDWTNNVAIDNKYQYNGMEMNDDFGLNLNLTVFRSYDPALARWHQFDPKNPFEMSPYCGMANNPILYSDMLGDTVKYANEDVEKYIKRFTSPTVTNRKGKEKNNSEYNESFAQLVSLLESSETVFTFTDNTEKLSDPKGAVLGELTAESDGSGINIVVPDWKGTANEENQLRNGGRNYALFEEAFHATQFVKGDILLINNGGKFSLGISKSTTSILVEANAKIFAADNVGIMDYAYNYGGNNYRISTWAGLIRATNGDANRVQTVGVMLIQGVSKSYPTTDTDGAAPIRFNHGAPYKTY
jgi:RHS repeat-associated protein